MSRQQFTPLGLYIGEMPRSSTVGEDPLWPINKFEPSAQFDNSELLQSMLALQNTVEMQARSIESMEKLLEAQTQTLISHGLLIRSIAGQQTVRNRDIGPKCEVTELKLFPFDSLDALQDVEENIDKIPYDDLLSYIKNCINGRKISKCTDVFFTRQFLLTINWDGSQGKSALKRFTLFNGHVYDAFQSEDTSLSYTQYEAEMKLGLKLAKNRHYKQVSILNKSANAGRACEVKFETSSVD